MDPILGMIMLWPINWAPSGWAFCFGQLLNISQNSALYSLLGTQFGGDGITTFALPDLRGRVIVGAGQGGGLPPHVFGERGGVETANITLTTANLPPHNHTLPAAGTPAYDGDGNSPSPNGTVPAKISTKGTYTNLYSSAEPNTTMKGQGAATSGATGNGAPIAVNNMQPYQVLNYIIATQGLYPVRD